MNQSYTEKSKPKSGKTNDTTKRIKPSIEAIKVTIEKKRECNSKALEIVTSFSDGIVSESCLVEKLPYINQEHYQDIIEERAINKLCGYPPCARNLENIPTKQYHISTTHNKVFDITDRKNFCSNLCYKASKYIKDQILTSPVWLRDSQPSTAYRLISLQSKGGIAGDEVDLGHACIKPQHLEDDTSSTTSTSVPTALLETNIDNLQTIVHTSSTNECNNDDTLVCPKLSNYQLIPDNSQTCNLPNKSSNQENVSAEPFNQTDRSSDICFSTITADKENCINKSLKHSTGDPVYLSERPFSSAVEDTPPSLTSANERSDKVNVPHLIEDKKPESVGPDSISVTSQKLLPKPLCKTPHKRKASSKDTQKNLSPTQSVVLKVEQILKEWLSFDSLSLLLGEDKVKEMLAEKSDYIKQYTNKTGSTADILFYERYLAICRKLNILELEDTKVDSSFREEAKKPLPDYETLKEEAKNMDLKVRMFYRGDKQVQFEEPNNREDDKDLSNEPVLPLVDLHAQKALRRRIVIDKLRRVLQDLQKSLGLRGFNLSEEVRTLIATFTLSAHNITMKPGEWNLLAIVIIKLLSLRDQTLQQALSSISTSKHLTLLLMSYSLDTAYLDRLIIWLTDLESVIQKFE
uniref:RNA polymerase II subunit B1 CTD phosphatase RPAP2 homolog n=1 Tax=Graphocephala atropunctata TaxID=36148 RepID=A0A1B6M2Y7_9HEMI